MTQPDGALAAPRVEEWARTPSLTVIVPVYNEAPGLRQLHRRLREALRADAEIVFVDDGSRDGSDGTLAEIAAGDPLARALRLRRHLGKSHALAAGFAAARGALIATIDADLQEEPKEIELLIETLDDEKLDLVGGWRRVRRDAPGRVRGSRLFNALVSFASGAKFLDINCGLKVMRREVIEEISLASGFHRFIPLLAHWAGFRVGEREIEHRPREHGDSRYGGERIFHGLMDLLVVLFLMRADHRPSRHFILAGILLSLGGIGCSSYIAYLRLAYGTIQSRYPLLALGALLCVAGLQIASLGFFAEMIAYNLRSRRASAPSVEDLANRTRKGERIDKDSRRGAKAGEPPAERGR